MALIRWLQRLWHPVSEALLFVRPLRLILLPLALLLAGLLFSAQGQDCIRALVEFDPACTRVGRIAGFFAATSFVAFQAWFWSRQLLRIDFPHRAGTRHAASPTIADVAARHPGLQTWTPRILGMAAYAIPILALLNISGTYGDRAQYTRLVIWSTIAGLALAGFLFLVLVLARRRLFLAGEPPVRVTSQAGLGRPTTTILIGSGIVVVLFVIATALKPLTVGWFIPSPSMVMLAAGSWMAIGSWLVYWADRYRIPLLGGLVVIAVLFSPLNDNHGIRRLSRDLGGDPGTRRSVAGTFTDWYGQLARKYGDGTQPVFVVATEGGGIRAAYWTAAVLSELQDEAPAFADHVFAISGVSGGSVGAVVFTSLVADPNAIVGQPDCAEGPKRTRRFLAQQVLSFDALAPTLASMLHADLVQRLLPAPVMPDRAAALETGWELGWSAHVRTADGRPDAFLKTGFLRMYQDRPDQLVPSLFLNSTDVETGRRMIASNCRPTDDEIHDSIDLLDRLKSDMALSTAAHNSARFTYISPAGTLTDSGRLEHVVDGGYFENSGAATATEIVRVLESPEVKAGRRYAAHLILIKFEGRTRQQRMQWMDELLSPPVALLHTREARGTLAYAQAKHELPEAPYEFVLAEADNGVVLPLGWLLAPRTRNAIDLQIGATVSDEVPANIRATVEQNAKNVRAIVAQLGTPVPTGPAAMSEVQKAAEQSEKAMRQPR